MLTRSAHGSRNAGGGAYDYLVRVNLDGQATLRHALLRTRFQLNPRTLPELAPGHNELIYTSGQAIMRRELAGEPEQSVNARYVSDGGQGYWIPQAGGAGDLLFRIAGQDGAPLTGFDAGGRFLDLSGGLAPDKFTAEVRRVTPLPARQPAASIAWSRSPDGPFETIWAGLDEATDVGPLVNEPTRSKVAELVESATADGGKVVTGGHAPERRGYFYQPTVIDQVLRGRGHPRDGDLRPGGTRGQVQLRTQTPSPGPTTPSSGSSPTSTPAT